MQGNISFLFTLVLKIDQGYQDRELRVSPFYCISKKLHFLFQIGATSPSSHATIRATVRHLSLLYDDIKSKLRSQTATRGELISPNANPTAKKVK